METTWTKDWIVVMQITCEVSGLQKWIQDLSLSNPSGMLELMHTRIVTNMSTCLFILQIIRCQTLPSKLNWLCPDGNKSMWWEISCGPFKIMTIIRMIKEVLFHPEEATFSIIFFNGCHSNHKVSLSKQGNRFHRISYNIKRHCVGKSHQRPPKDT